MYKYKVVYYESTDELIESGIVLKSDQIEATKVLLDYYGADSVIALDLQWFDDFTDGEDTVILSTDMLHDVLEQKDIYTTVAQKKSISNS